MPPLPKKKHSRSRKGKRNAHNAIVSPALSVCKGCDSVIQPHRICTFCGNYKDRTMPGNWKLENRMSKEPQPQQTSV